MLSAHRDDRASTSSQSEARMRKFTRAILEGTGKRDSCFLGLLLIFICKSFPFNWTSRFLGQALSKLTCTGHHDRVCSSSQTNLKAGAFLFLVSLEKCLNAMLQQNKRFKSKHSTKGSLKEAAKGKFLFPRPHSFSRSRCMGK